MSMVTDGNGAYKYSVSASSDGNGAYKYSASPSSDGNGAYAIVSYWSFDKLLRHFLHQN